MFPLYVGAEAVVSTWLWTAESYSACRRFKSVPRYQHKRFCSGGRSLSPLALQRPPSRDFGASYETFNCRCLAEVAIPEALLAPRRVVGHRADLCRNEAWEKKWSRQFDRGRSDPGHHPHGFVSVAVSSGRPRAKPRTHKTARSASPLESCYQIRSGSRRFCADSESKKSGRPTPGLGSSVTAARG
jgi:hypothetical protein